MTANTHTSLPTEEPHVAPDPSLTAATKTVGDGVLTDGSSTLVDEVDPSLPQNWPTSRKWLIVVMLSLMSLMVYVYVVFFFSLPSQLIVAETNHCSSLAYLGP